VRFIFVDRILHMERGQSIVTLKGVSAAEDYFADHFPGCPIMPGALIVECFEQSVRLLIGATSAFQETGTLRRITRASFKRFVRPGDRLEVRCDIQSRSEAEAKGGEPQAGREIKAGTPQAGREIKVAARAEVDGQVVAEAALEFAISPVAEDAETGKAARRLRDFYDTLMVNPVELAMRGVKP
jgi:3-hydroxymyristoyl/3-hydroxydecanoyl-(acyl carrier protein) dehydratase